MGFSGGGGSQTRPHTHDGLQINDGGSLNFDNVTQAGPLTAGDITYSDGAHLQRLPIGGAGDFLVVNGGGNAPEWATSGDPHDAGMLVMWAGTPGAIPTGWLLCDGSSVATATYPALFTALGYTYGGAGANFNLPNMVSRFPRGVATQTAATGGADSLTLTTAEMPSHTHTVNDGGHSHNYWTYNGGSGSVPLGSGATNTLGLTTSSSTTGISNNSTGGGGSFDNRPAYLEMQFIIKT